jgi:uncharacterized OsmC-like protein
MPEHTQKVTKVNGVNVTALGETVEAIQGTPDLARFTFRASNKWLTCGQNRTHVKGFYGAGQEHSHARPFHLDADEPQVLLGEGKAPGPADYVLTALAACMATSLSYHAAAKGITVESVETSLEGNIDLHGFLGLKGDVPKGFQDISVTMKIKSDASAEQLAELANMSPVADTLKRAIPVEVTIEKQ